MDLFKITKFSLLILFLLQGNLFSDNPHYLDFKYVLNQSEAGKKAQKSLKDQLTSGLKNIQEKEKKIQSEEEKIIKQKKVLSPEEYKKKVTELRKKVSSLQKERNTLLESVAKKRSKARQELLDNLNPIVKEYMKEKNIRMVLDKKNLLLADEALDITKDIIKILNKNLKSIKLN